jgi:hypothetical protein
MKFIKYGSAIVGGAMASFASQASAQSEGCAAINGYSAAVLEVLYGTTLTNSALKQGEVIILTASSVVSGYGLWDFESEGSVTSAELGTNNESLTWAFADASDPFTFGGGAFSPIYSGSAVPIAKTIAVPAGGIVGFGLTELGANYTTLTDVQITCTDGVFTAVRALSQTNSGHQQQALRSALNQNISSRLQGSNGGVSASSSRIFFSAPNTQEPSTIDANVWFSFDGRAYFEGYEGYSADYSTGIDALLGTSSLIGLMVGAGVTNLKDSSIADSESTYVMLGAYGGHALANGLQLDGYLAYAAVDYEVGTTEFETERMMASLSLQKAMEVSSGAVQLRASLSGSWEEFPVDVSGVAGASSQQYKATAGARHDWSHELAGTPLTPWASLDLEYGYAEDYSGVSDEFVSPRVAFGLNGFVGVGALNASIDLGQTTSDVYDAGFNLSYDFKF